MVYPKIFLGNIPNGAQERRLLRRQALDLRSALRSARGTDPTYLLLHFYADDGAVQQDIDLLLLRPNAVIVGAIRAYSGPIKVQPGASWIDRQTNQPIVEQHGLTPLQRVRGQRDVVRNILNARSHELNVHTGGARPFDRTIGALICAAATHPDSRISLDIDDHLQLLKILALEELRGFVAMIRTDVQLTEEAMQVIVRGLFGGNLWLDGTRFAFELAPICFQLRVLDQGHAEVAILPLMEGENVIGRRRSAKQYEHRLTLVGDDLISTDHAHLICTDDDSVLLRDISKNGTWVTLPDGQEELLRGAERLIEPGTILRMGLTRLLLERID